MDSSARHEHQTQRMSTSTAFARAIEISAQLRTLKRADTSESDVVMVIAFLAKVVNSGKIPFFFTELAIRTVFDKRNGPVNPIVTADGENGIIRRLHYQVDADKQIQPADYCPAELRTGFWDGIMSEGSRLQPQGTSQQRQTANLFNKYIDCKTKAAVPQWKLDMQTAKEHPKPSADPTIPIESAEAVKSQTAPPPYFSARTISLIDIPWVRT